MKLILLIFITCLVYANTIYIAASSNISYAMDELINKFKITHKNTNIKVVYASSGKLTAQILHNAPYDIFLSANTKYPEFLYKKGFSVTEPKIYAKGLIGLFSIKYKNLNLNRLLQSNQIAIANPKFAPYGKAAIEMLKNANIYNKVKNKLIYSETVTGVIPYVINSADIGVVAKSSIYSKKIQNLKFFYKDINKSLYTPIKQAAILLKNNKEAKDFYKFIFSNEAKKIFNKFGYE